MGPIANDTETSTQALTHTRAHTQRTRIHSHANRERSDIQHGASDSKDERTKKRERVICEREKANTKRNEMFEHTLAEEKEEKEHLKASTGR